MANGRAWRTSSRCGKNTSPPAAAASSGSRVAIVRPGTGEFCVATSNGATSCDYSDLQNCARDANRQGAVCVEAPPGAAGNVPDPYRYLTEPQTEGND